MNRRIVAVRTRILEVALEKPVAMSLGTMDHRRTVVVEIESNDGLIGYGESWVNHPRWAAQERVLTIENGLAPELTDVELIGTRPIVDRLRARFGRRVTQWGATGPLSQAISGIEIALFDLLGKAEGVSVATLLGGAVRREIPVYASAVSPQESDGIIDQFDIDGFRAIKCRVGFGLETDHATLAAVRQRVGDKTPVYVDANQAWSVPEAVESIRSLSSHGIVWFEEPVFGNHLADLETLFGLTGAGIATGENNYGLQEFATLACSPAIRVLQPDVSKVGGIHAADHIAELSRATGTEVIPHAYGGPIALAATAQLAAASPGVTSIEYDVRENPLTAILLNSPLAVKDGSLVLPDGPGLGVEINNEVIEQYTVRMGGTP